MGELSNIPNIGKNIESSLTKVGILNYEQLRIMGSKNAWLKIKDIDPSACINRLYALEGAIQGIRWHFLSPDIRKELWEFYNDYKNI